MENEKRRDLIDRSRLLRDPYFQEDRYPESHLLRMAIGNQTTVDAVEVVRCKGCKYARNMAPIGESNYELGECFLREEDEIVIMVYDDDFCSYGERRTDG